MANYLLYCLRPFLRLTAVMALAVVRAAGMEPGAGRRCAGSAAGWLVLVAMSGAWAVDDLEAPAVGRIDAEWNRDVVLKSWSTVDGMPSNEVTALAQTAEGYLWVGTSSGLARFDGVNFVTYGEEEGIPRIPVTKLRALPDGRLWIRNESEESFWLQDGVFRRESRMIADVVAGPDGESYVYDEEKIIRAPKEGGPEMAIPSPEPTVTLYANLAVTRDGTIWLLQLNRSTTRVWKWRDGAWEEWTGYEALSEEESFVDWGQVVADAAGRLWFGSFAGGFIRRDEEGESILPVAWSDDDGVKALMAGKDGSIWAGPLGGGLFRFDGESFGQIHLSPQKVPPVVLSILEGAGGEVWVGTEDQGLLQLGRSQVRHHRLADHDGVAVTSLWAESPGNLVVGTNGMGALRWRDGEVSRYARDEDFDRNYKSVGALWQDSTGSLWMGTGKGLHEFRDGNWLSDREFAARFADAGDTVGSIFGSGEEEGGLWVGRYHGGVDWVKGRHVESMEFPLTGTIHDLTQGPDGKLWVATMGGVIATLAKDRKWDVLGGEFWMSRATLTVLFRDAAGGMWVGTNGDGLYRWSGERFVKVEIPALDAPQNILQIQEDDEGWLWLGSTRGIYGVNVQPLREGKPLTDALLWLGASDGMGVEQCTRMKAVKDADGRLYFGTTNGFVSFDPREVKKAGLIPRPLLEQVTIEGASPVQTTGFDAIPEVPPGSRFQIRFTGLGPELAERMRFRYRMEGLDADWVDLGTRRFVEFSQTPPGRYRFQLQAGARGEWNPQSAVLDLRVRPFYWQTWWFRALAVGAVVSAIALIVKGRERRQMERLLAEIERKRAVNEERERMARDLHDSLGSGIVHAGILAEDLTGERESEEAALRLRERLKLLGSDLNTAIWMTNPSYDRLSRVCDYLASYSHEFLRDAGLRCRLTTNDALPDAEIAPATRHHLFQAVKESLNNVVKHAGATQVWLDIAIRDGFLRLEIRDDGRGFDPASARLKERHGLKNLADRMILLRGNAVIEPSSEGTTVVLTLPVPLPGSSGSKKQADRRTTSQDT